MHKSVRYVFFGTPEFAALVLERLISSGLVPLAVICNPDRPVGRKKIITPPPVKVLAEKHGVQVFQPEKLPEIKDALKNLNAALFLIAAYAKILRDDIISIPRLGTLGIHPSLLPKHRGASPIQSAILENDKETGVALYRVDAEVDHGPVYGEKTLPLHGNETYETLMRKLAELGGDYACELLPEIGSGNISPKEQNHAAATFTKKFVTEDGFVSETDLKAAQNGNAELAGAVYRKIRALNPEPGVWTLRQAQGEQKRIKLLAAELQKAGLRITLLQEEGRRPTRVALR